MSGNTQIFIDLTDLTLYDSLIRGDTTPVMDGTGATGTSKKFARADHVHPSDSTKVDKVNGKGLSANDFTDTLKNKLDGIAAGAEVNVQADWNESSSSSDAYIANKPSIPSSASDVGAIPTTEKGANSGVCELDSSGLVPSNRLPSYVDDVIEAYPRTGQTELSSTWLATGSASGSVITPETGKIYVLMADSTNYATNTQFRWGGTTYVKLNDGGIRAATTAEIEAIVT